MHLSKLAIPKPKLAEFAKTRNFSPRLTSNYLVHSVLSEAFSDCLSPFTAQEKGRIVRVLFYSDVPFSSERDADDLETRAQVAASPEAYSAIRWEESASKPLPDPFPEGMTLQFELRACPVVRKASAGEGVNKEGERRTWKEGDELDVFLVEQWTSEETLSREEVYADWLERQFDVRGGAALQSVNVTGFSLTEMTRRSHDNDRSVKKMKRPDATFSGTLDVTDADAFTDVLRSGLGRHKSFGYGMLRIQPA